MRVSSAERGFKKIMTNVEFLCLLAGLEKLMKTYAANPSFSNQQNREEIELLLDEVNKNC